MMIFDKAPFPSCHASTIVETAPGKLMAAWFGGKEEKAKDVQIWASHFDGTKWSALEVLGTEPGQPCWNPVLFRTAKNELSLWYKFGPDPMTWSGALRTSNDDGVTWSKPTLLPAGFYGPVRAKPIVLNDGTLLAGTSVETYHMWTPYVDRSTDGGKTWLRSNSFAVKEKPNGGQIQPTLFQTKDGKVVALMRSQNPLRICRAESTDNGKTFTAAVATDLHNPSSGIDVVKTREGDLFLIYNPAPIGRVPISLARSTDDGVTWAKVTDLETEQGEYSYPAIIQSSDGKLQITYTWRRRHIKHETIDPAKYRS